MRPPEIVFLHGPAASGKLTIARELAALTGFALFHNHLVVDTLLALFPFGSPEFVRHRERLWLDLMGDATATGRSLVFTFNPERTVAADFPQTLAARVAAAGGRMRFVEIVCAEAEIERRLEAASRREFKKLADLALYRRLRAEGAFAYPPIASELRVDSGTEPPAASAARIATALALPQVGA